MDTKITSCNNSFRCWECQENCPVKTLFMLPKSYFYANLQKFYKVSVGMMLADNVPFLEAQKEQEIWVVTLVTSRTKFLTFTRQPL